MNQKNKKPLCKKCKTCKKTFYKTSKMSKLEWSKKKFCCRKCYNKFTRGKNTYQWKGGITKLNSAIRKDVKYIKWRNRCFIRDNYKCQITGKTGILVVHHIKSVKNIIDDNNIKTIEDARRYNYLWNINNGITMLESIHKLFHKTYKKDMSKQEINKFKYKLCKKCKLVIRSTLSMCENCRQKHNKNTRTLKRKYRKENKCCMCGLPSETRRCKECQKIEYSQQKNRPYNKIKIAKTGIYGKLKHIIEII